VIQTVGIRELPEYVRGFKYRRRDSDSGLERRATRVILSLLEWSGGRVLYVEDDLKSTVQTVAGRGAVFGRPGYDEDSIFICMNVEKTPKTIWEDTLLAFEILDAHDPQEEDYIDDPFGEDEYQEACKKRNVICWYANSKKSMNDAMPVLEEMRGADIIKVFNVPVAFYVDDGVGE